VFLELDNNPIPIVNRSYKMNGIVERLFDIVNEVMGRNLVSHLYLAPGAHRIGKGSVATNLEGTDDNCMSLESLPEFAAARARGRSCRETSRRDAYRGKTETRW
jgi:hypothetical protein